MSNWNIRFTKEMIAKAEAKGRHVCAVGHYGHGRGEAFMYLTPEDTTRVWLFAHHLNHGKAPADALAEAERAIAEYKAEIEAKATEVA